MPFLDLPPDLKLFHEIDDWTDAWTTPEPVLMIHGFTENTTAWRGWVPHLARYYRVIRFDQRGFGQTGAVPKDFTFSTELLVDDLVRIVNQIARGPVHVIAGKSGGITAARLAATRPDLVKSIVFASVPVTAPQGPGWLEHMDTHGVRSWARMTMPPRLGSKLPARAIDWWVEMMGNTAVSTAHAYLRWVTTTAIQSDLGGVRCPALVITTNAPRRAPEENDVYRKLIKNVEVVTIPVDGYHAAGTAPDACAQATLQFLQKQSATQQA